MSQNTRKDPRAKVLTMTVRYRSATIDEFIEHHSYDVSRGGMFIKTPSPFPAGTLLKFEVKIAEDQKVMQGVGRVVWKRETSDSDPDKPCGMGVKFIKIDDESRRMIELLLQSRGGGESAYDIGNPNATSGGSSMPPSGPVFPKSSPSDQPAPEDRTVMKPAAELLEDALKQAGGAAASLAPEVPAATFAAQPAPVETSAETKRSSERAEAPAPDDAAAAAAWAHDALLSLPDKESLPPSSEVTAKKDVALEEPAPKSPEKAASKAPVRAAPPSPPRKEVAAATPAETEKPSRRPSTRPAAAAAPEAEEEGGGGGKAVLLFLVAAAVAGGIYFLSKRGQETPPEPPAATQAAPTPAPPAEPTAAASTAEPAPSVAPEASAAASAASAEAVPSASAVVPAPVVSAPVAPVPVAPKPKAKAKPKPEESAPSEAAPSESKPSESKPAEPKPAEPKPAEPKPAEPKPESKPKEAPPATDNPY